MKRTMKLDRNVNHDGRGKYALINLRDNTVQWGNEPRGQFFVLKYKDRFAADALLAYAKSIKKYLAKHRLQLSVKEVESLEEYRKEILAEARSAFVIGTKTPD